MSCSQHLALPIYYSSGFVSFGSSIRMVVTYESWTIGHTSDQRKSLRTPMMSTTPKGGDIFIVGIAGPSGSGKSTVARRVASRLGGYVISMETYAVEMNHLPLEERAKLDYDAPAATDVDLLGRHIRSYASGHGIEAPIYDFARHLRVTGQCEHIPANALLIVEGILALHFAELRTLFNLSIYLDAPEDVCFHRRKVRDITERQRSTDFILWQYENAVLPAARKYLLPSKRYADFALEGNADLSTVEKNLYDIIVQKRVLAASR
jgi:uridine kinase